MIETKRITPETALVFKDARLRALQDTPLAFSSTYAKESLLPEEERAQILYGWNDTAAG